MKMNKQKTAVDLLIDKLEQKGFDFKFNQDVIEQAKELEKRQIVDAWCDGAQPDKDNKIFAEQYYSDTYE